MDTLTLIRRKNDLLEQLSQEPDPRTRDELKREYYALAAQYADLVAEVYSRRRS